MEQAMRDPRYWFACKGFAEAFKVRAAGLSARCQKSAPKPKGKVSMLRSSSSENDESENENGDEKELQQQSTETAPVEEDGDEKERETQGESTAENADAVDGPENHVVPSGEGSEDESEDDRKQLVPEMEFHIVNAEPSPQPDVSDAEAPPSTRKPKGKRARSPEKEKQGSPCPPPKSLFSVLCFFEPDDIDHLFRETQSIAERG